MRSLEPVLLAVADATKQIARIVARAMTDDIYGVALGKDGLPLEENVQGEVQQKLDVLCNTIMLRAFCGSSRSINSVASEEEDEPRCCSDVMVRKSFDLAGNFQVDISHYLWVNRETRHLQSEIISQCLIQSTALKTSTHLYPLEVFLVSTEYLLVRLMATIESLCFFSLVVL
jgi:hypothetical protein